MYLTRHETELTKTILSRIWETWCGITVLLVCLFPTLFWFLSTAVVVVWALFRLCRRYPRRHPTCATKGFFHGWFFRRQYYRTLPTPYQPGGKKQFRLVPRTETYDDRVECHFDGHCLECGENFEIKPTVLKSFAHRPLAFVFW